MPRQPTLNPSTALSLKGSSCIFPRLSFPFGPGAQAQRTHARPLLAGQLSSVLMAQELRLRPPWTPQKFGVRGP